MISIIPKLIILKQENREYDVDHTLLIKDIINIMLKQTSLEIDLECFQFPWRREIKLKRFSFIQIHSVVLFLVLEDVNMN